ncbi:hypothetical protein [Defluviimonas salinarum]|uniref:YHYH domain-containing protein n=1 Tax=Defluviimonas salinarum TaxID=2992147 RepID=A0ABT3J8A9_9RHOB|nr:hypothetical protein [Defluviimonas salinarum]MCW3783917.1 hypothetical protein [Defluviimonas salinarum]
MKRLYLVAVIACLAAGQALALPVPPAGEATAAEHSGGCRKDSPPGQCCHAGSQPYHCH